MRALFALLVALLVLPAAVHATPSSGAASVDAYTAPNGATGFLGTPAGAPLGFVVILHGYGHPASDHVAHLQHLADEGWLAVAMDYPGDINGFPLRAGADATESAIADLAPRVADKPHVLYSVSMGTAVASLVLAEIQPTREGGETTGFDDWVDNEGLSMLAETWTEASLLAPANAFAKTASDAITTECGGSPAQNPTCYHDRSAALRGSEIGADALQIINGRTHTLRDVVLTHGLNDGLVPHNQGRAMESALHAAGVATEFYTYLRCGAGNEGTTLTGYAPTGMGGAGLAGHGTESIDAHCLTHFSFERLDAVLAGRVVFANGEHLVDGDGAEELA